MSALIISVWLSLAAFSAHAADPFTVSAVPVDATASNAIEAQTLASQQGQLEAAKILMARVTLESERMARPLPELTTEIVQRMIRAISVDNEKRSANRYLGDLSVAFNPRQVQSFLRDQDLTLVTSQARPRVLVPVIFSADDTSASQTQAFVNSVSSGRYANALTPISAVAEIRSFAPTQNELAAIGEQFGVKQVLLVEGASAGQGYSAALTDYSLDTGQSRRLRVAGALSPDGLASQLVTQLEDDWKEASVTLASDATTSPVSVLYGSLIEWQKLQDAINGSAQIQDARLDALSKDGALMTITFGDFDRLVRELQFKGVQVRRDPDIGLVFVSAGRF